MKKAIMTGASSGLGYEIASKLIEGGIEVINLSRTPSKLKITNIKTDLTKNSDIEKAIKIVVDKHKDADTLILCAGVLHRQSLGKVDSKEIDDDFAVNITSSIKITDKVMPIIKANQGDVVIIGSTSSHIASGIDSAAYVAAKHAVLGYIKVLQTEFKKDNVRIIGVHPGGFQSQFHIKAKSELKQEDLMDPKYIAEIIVASLNLPRTMEVSEIIINRKKLNK